MGDASYTVDLTLLNNGCWPEDVTVADDTLPECQRTSVAASFAEVEWTWASRNFLDCHAQRAIMSGEEEKRKRRRAAPRPGCGCQPIRMTDQPKRLKSVIANQRFRHVDLHTFSMSSIMSSTISSPFHKTSICLCLSSTEYSQSFIFRRRLIILLS